MRDISRKDAERFIGAANTRAASVSNKLFLSAAALVMLWVSSLEGQLRTAHQVFASQRQIEFERLVNGALTGTRPYPWKTKQQNSGITSRQREVWERRRTEFNRRIADIETKKSTIQSEVPFDVFGLKFAASPQLAALFWLLLIDVGLGYLLVQRRMCLSLLARGVRCLKEDTSAPQLLPPPLAPAMPLWLAPLPKGDGRFVAAREIADVLGWGQSGLRWRVSTALVIMVAIWVVALRVSWVGILTVGAMRGTWFLVCSIAIFLGGAAVLTVEWWMPYSVDDAYEEDSYLLQSTRRRFLAVLSGTLVCAVTSPWVLGTVLKAYGTPGPKRVRHPLRPQPKGNVQATKLPPGFYENPRSHIVYYVTQAGTLLAHGSAPALHTLRPIPVERIGSKISGDRVEILWVNRQRASISYETAALDALSRDNPDPDEACRILLVGIRQAIATRSHFERLGELCATIVIRKGLNEKFFAELERLAATTRRGFGVSKRSDTWRDPNSRWRLRRVNSKSAYRWSGLPM